MIIIVTATVTLAWPSVIDTMAATGAPTMWHKMTTGATELGE
jgi:hypothetical protein